jgi:hypothetical protein
MNASFDLPFPDPTAAQLIPITALIQKQVSGHELKASYLFFSSLD